MRTGHMFKSLCPETQNECRETLDMMKRMGECRPDEWDHIVNYYYDRDNAMPNGWFNYWD